MKKNKTKLTNAVYFKPGLNVSEVFISSNLTCLSYIHIVFVVLYLWPVSSSSTNAKNSISLLKKSVLSDKSLSKFK